jgi:hypothetical protein
MVRIVSLFAVTLGAAAENDFCCYYPVAKKLSGCDVCEEKAFDTDGRSDCESDQDNTWCPSASPSPSPTPSPSPSPSPSGSCPDGWQKATWTGYESYPRCCPENPNYDPSAPKDECDDYSGCKYSGLFAFHECSGKDGQCSLSWVQNHAIVSFFTTSGEHKQFKDKKIRVQALGQTAEVLVADTCGDHDCGGCCTKNAKKHGGALIDMEFFTVQKYWPDIKEPAENLDSVICWQPASDAKMV